jgi:isopentenyldiphosphate isomerase
MKKKYNTITITVSGTPGSGKSRLTYLLKRLLKEYGLDIEFDHGIDFKDEDHFDAVANNDIEEVIQRIKETTNVSLKQIQLERNPNVKTIAQQLNVTEFPFIIEDKNGNIIYYETSDNYWIKWEYHPGGKLIYYENSHGHIEDNRPKSCADKVVEIDGIKYKLTAV